MCVKQRHKQNKNPKHLRPVVINGLSDIFNATLSAGYFPDTWKILTLKLIPKPNNSSHTDTSYKPISLLEVPGKILERIINNTLRNHLEYKNEYFINQFGFRKGKSTHQAIVFITEHIAHSKTDERECKAVLRDISMAFDKV